MEEVAEQLKCASEELNFSKNVLAAAKMEYEALNIEEKQNSEEYSLLAQTLKSCEKEYTSLTEKCDYLEMEYEKRLALNDTLPLRLAQVERLGRTLVSRFNQDSARTRRKILSIVIKANDRANRGDGAVEATVAALKRVRQTRGENQVLLDQALLKMASNSQEVSFLAEAEKKLHIEINNVKKALSEYP